MKTTIRRLIAITALMALCAATVWSQAREGARILPSRVQTTSLNGKVTNKGTVLTVSTAGVRPLSIDVGVNAQTSFSLNGAVTRFADVMIGDWVVVTYQPLPDQAVNAISVEAHRHRSGTVDSVLEPLPPPAGYRFCPYVGSGGTVTGTPCYCKRCGGAGSGMVW